MPSSRQSMPGACWMRSATSCRAIIVKGTVAAVAAWGRGSASPISCSFTSIASTS